MKKLLFLLLLATPIFVNGQFGAHTAASTSGTNARYLWSGNLGIGTAQNTVPSEKFHVNGSVRSNRFNAINGDFASIGSTDVEFYTGASSTDGSGGALQVTIKSTNGFMGIGTASASITDRLHVTGNTRTSGNFLSDAGIFNVQHASNNFRLQTNGTERLTVLSSSGNVGIGIPSPAYKLDVSGVVNATGYRVGATEVGIWPVASSNLSYTAGMVSIGTTATPAGYKLAVGGKIVAEELIVKLQANWPDYVFESDFQLMPLREVEGYVKLNKHLPGVPTAADVKENGVAVGEMNAVLLKKIEELTLYVIELKKENEAQQKELEDLKEKK